MQMQNFSLENIHFSQFQLTLRNHVDDARREFWEDWWPFSQSKHFPQAGLCQPLND